MLTRRRVMLGIEKKIQDRTFASSWVDLRYPTNNLKMVEDGNFGTSWWWCPRASGSLPRPEASPASSSSTASDSTCWGAQRAVAHGKGDPQHQRSTVAISARETDLRKVAETSSGIRSKGNFP